jgi:hypothetical protein
VGTFFISALDGATGELHASAALSPVPIGMMPDGLESLSGSCGGQSPETASDLYRPNDRCLSAKLVPTFAGRGCHAVSVTDPLRP